MGKKAAKKVRMAAYRRASDVGRIAIPIATVTACAFRRDRAAMATVIGSAASTYVICKLLKKAVPEERPDHENAEAFPSGHTAETVAAAVALGRTTDWQSGGAALALSGLVGAARILARRHYVHDVIAGAGIGSAIALGISSMTRHFHVAARDRARPAPTMSENEAPIANVG